MFKTVVFAIISMVSVNVFASTITYHANFSTLTVDERTSGLPLLLPVGTVTSASLPGADLAGQFDIFQGFDQTIGTLTGVTISQSMGTNNYFTINSGINTPLHQTNYRDSFDFYSTYSAGLYLSNIQIGTMARATQTAPCFITGTPPPGGISIPNCVGGIPAGALEYGYEFGNRGFSSVTTSITDPALLANFYTSRLVMSVLVDNLTFLSQKDCTGLPLLDLTSCISRTAPVTNQWITINDSSQLTVTYEYDAFAPVPVPAAAWIFVSGLIALIGFIKRT